METIEVKRGNVVVLIRPTKKADKVYFVVDYRVNGQRKLVWRSTLAEARAVANEACDKISTGQFAALDLSSADRNTLLRAKEILDGTGKTVEMACIEAAETWKILGGRVAPIEACRDWSKRSGLVLEKISVRNAVDKLIAEMAKENRSKDYVRVLTTQMNNIARYFQRDVDAIEPSTVSAYLVSLSVGERSKRNQRDAIGVLNRWLILRKFLNKGTDWLEGVQQYSNRKHGEITIYEPAEMKKILAQAKKEGGWRPAMLAINAFSALRHSEICRLNWEQIELSDKAGESFIEVKAVATTKSDQRRRLVPISDNLKAWLQLTVKKSGPVCPVSYQESMKHLPSLVERAGVKFKKNALRHSGISYRVAQTGDIARVADDSGNSVAVIKSNYLRRVKPAAAAEWFNIFP